MANLFLFLTFLLFINVVRSDTPANCTLEDLHGNWHIYVYSGGHDKTLECSNPGQVHVMISMTFSGVNTVVMDKIGAKGHFNLIYNQGFEAIINNRKFFTFFAWEQVDANHTKYWCDRTMFGWSHDVLGNDWACFNAVKQTTHSKHISFVSKQGTIANKPKQLDDLLKQPFKVEKSMILKINNKQKSWVAGYYPELEKMTFKQVLLRSGYGNGPISSERNCEFGDISENAAVKFVNQNHPKVITSRVPRKLRWRSNYIKATLPQEFDWRNVDGQNFVSPIRNQGQCGSCYAFASMAMLEARVRIMTNNTKTPVFSPQDVVSCSEYAQGCAGGFPYLIAGKYAQDFGVIDESCYPYQGNDTKTCSPAKTCERTYVAKYEYIGGYYGASTEENMMEALIANGPIAVGLEVYQDLQLYKSGIYHHVYTSESSPLSDYNPFQLTNHAVLIVGYGADAKTGEKFWIVKNSWGEAWGEKGFFRIRKGTDEVAIESLAMQSWPIPQIQ